MTARGRVLLLAALLFLPFLGSHDLWAPDEPRYAEVAQEMVRDGHWWHPHVNGRKYRDKPPLYFWAEAAISLPFGGVNEWTARAPSVACGFLVLLVLLDLGRRLPLARGRPETAATVAALAFATCWLGAWMSRRVNLDVPLAAAAAAAIWAAWRGQEAARERRRVAPWALLAGISTALAVMTKGPVVLLFVLGAALPLLAHRGFRAERAAGGLVETSLVGLLGFVAVLLAWLVPASVIGGYDVFGIVGEQVVDRAAKGLHHVQPPWYYLQSLPLDFLPWTLLAIPALAALLRRGAKRLPADWLLLGWLILPLILLSVVVEKRNVYVVPALPALALIVGRWLAGLPEEGPLPRSLRWAGRLAAGLLGLLAIAGLVVALGWRRFAFVEEVADLPGLRIAAVGLALAALGGALVLVAGVLRRERPLSAAWAFALAFGGVELALFAAQPLADPIKSTRPAGVAIAELTADEPIASWPLFRAGYVHYSGRYLVELGSLDELEEWLAEQPRPTWVLTFDEHLAEAPRDGAQAPEVAWTGGVGHRKPVLLRYLH